MTAEGAPRIYLVTAEPSGDALAGDLIDALREQEPDVQIAGVGGVEMAARGIQSLYDTSELSVFGFFDGLRIAKLAHARALEAAEDAASFRADAVVAIDSYGFMLRLAWKLKDTIPDIPRIKYVGPQVFASRQGRARVIAENFDHLLAIHLFDAPFYERFGLPVTFVGNPALARDLSGDGQAFRQRYELDEERPLLLILFGSRTSELDRLFPHFSDAVARLRREFPELQVATVLSPTIEKIARERLQGDPILRDIVITDSSERRDAFHAADIALACSGTVTTELARVGVPTIAAYRLGWLLWAAARTFLMKSKYISLTNIAADDELIPEYVQTRCTGRQLAAALSDLLKDKDLRATKSRQLVETTRQMAGKVDPSQAAAAAILKIAKEKAGKV